jgi:hypothetical protein
MSALAIVGTRQQAIERGGAESAGLADLAASLLRRGDTTTPAATTANAPPVDRDLPGLAESILSLADPPKPKK